jgi:hypothetical protein
MRFRSVRGQALASKRMLQGFLTRVVDESDCDPEHDVHPGRSRVRRYLFQRAAGVCAEHTDRHMCLHGLVRVEWTFGLASLMARSRGQFDGALSEWSNGPKAVEADDSPGLAASKLAKLIPTPVEKRGPAAAAKRQRSWPASAPSRLYRPAGERPRPVLVDLIQSHTATDLVSNPGVKAHLPR